MTNSSFAPADWLPLQESLLRGLNHALSNRLSSLQAIAMLTEGAETLDPRMHEALTKDVEQLNDLLTDYRSLLSDPAPRREATRFADALARAGVVLTHHPDCRDVAFAPPAEGDGAEPVALVGKDAFRASVALLLALARGGGFGARVETNLTSADGWLTITARISQPVAPPEGSAEFTVLQRFAAAEGGNAKAPPGGDALVLTLPGLSRARSAPG